jgi:hypothetical protein
MVFNNKELHYIPPILLNYADDLVNPHHSPEIKAEYAHRFEVIQAYCERQLELYNKAMHKGPYTLRRKAAKKH